MRKLHIFFSALLLFAVAPHLSRAAQIIGGEITYSCTSVDSIYKVNLRIYVDADDNSPIFDSLSYESAACGMNSKVKLLPIGTTLLPQSCPASINVEERLFTGMIHLPRLSCNDWVLSYTTCCRSNAITSGAANQDFYLSAYLDNTLATCNNSPVFDSQSIISRCHNAAVIYDLKASDADGDSLVYSIVNCTQGQNISVSYNIGLSGSQPISATSLLTIDTLGVINFTPFPDSIQVAPICAQIEEYRNGVKIGEINRDILFESNLVPESCPFILYNN